MKELWQTESCVNYNLVFVVFRAPLMFSASKDLYKNGFQRQTYSVFLDLLQERCVVHDMRSKVDYRRVLVEQAEDDVTPLRKTYFRDTSEEKRELDAVVMELVGQHKRPADYIALCSEYHTLVLKNVPQMGILQKNEARRFITLLDAVYERICSIIAFNFNQIPQVKFYCSAAAPPDDLFIANTPPTDVISPMMHHEMLGELHADITSPSLPNISTYDTAPAAAIIDRTPSTAPAADIEFGKLSLFTGDDERFAFKRAVSRIHEMMGVRYANEAWRGGEGRMPFRVGDEHGNHEVNSDLIAYTEREYRERVASGDEAGYTGSLVVGRVAAVEALHGPKASAPRFAKAHFWAVEEGWGARAGSHNASTKRVRQLLPRLLHIHHIHTIPSPPTAMSDEHPSVTRFREYLRIKTVQPTPDYNTCVTFLQRQASEIGLPVRVVEPHPGKPHVIMTVEGRDPDLPSVLLNSHTDVVPVFLEKWSCDPFEAVKRENGDILARGAQDMKCVGSRNLLFGFGLADGHDGSLQYISYLEAIRNLRTKGWKPLRTIHLSFVADEEVGGGLGMKLLIKTPEFLALNVGFALDEGISSPTENIKVFYGERAPWWVKITSTGNTGHGSQFIKDTAAGKLVGMSRKELS
ncbi:hypothetical protein BC938DRAFT_471126 [Jimgerdemannia flammicorona]|uniref:Peptidase M20 dimerisation domain-containing protein n=1 Tax=Jimgerdemannia flammicorona TaxID=994334 RepID=A0A433Q8P4_9FUNG|nr:hypothetical protein BC938DRAFT_471126 [Jimgerdemannia flammicorona]